MVNVDGERRRDNGHAESVCEVLDSGSRAAHDECPDEEKDGLDDGHGLSLAPLRNGQSWHGSNRQFFQ